MKPRAARACARPLTAPSTMTLRKQPNRAKCPVNCRIRRSLERVRSNSSAGYRPATFPLDSQVGSLAARPIASIGPSGMGRRYSTLRRSTASSMGVLPVLTIRFRPRTAEATFSRAKWPAGQCYDGPLLPHKPDL
jgi:hypothetical protein